MPMPPVDPADQLAPGTLLDDRYEILRPLGTGGMGTVYLARHRRMGRLSAVKVLHPSMAGDREALDRFVREARNASRITHPTVCAVYDFGTGPGGSAYLAMEYVDGRSLGAILREQGALVPVRAAALVRDIAAGLDAAHALGIIHRDLKPDNIMVVGTPGTESVKLVDFGIAKALASELQREVTAPGVVVGTPDYMAPEQFAGDPADQRSDQYSLAVIAFRMLTGELPFSGATARETLTARLTSRPRTLADAAPDRRLPAAAQPVLDRALARRPADRFDTAGAFADALVAVLGTASDEASDLTPTVRLDAPTAPTEGVPPTVRAGRRRMARIGIGIGLVAAAATAIYQAAGPPAPTLAPADSTGNTTMPPAVEQQETVTARAAELPATRQPATATPPTPIPPLPDPEEVFAAGTREASRQRAEQIYFRTDAAPVLRAQAAFIVAQVHGEAGQYQEAEAWIRRAVAVNDSAPAGMERDRRTERYRSFLQQIELRRKEPISP